MPENHESSGGLDPELTTEFNIIKSMGFSVPVIEGSNPFNTAVHKNNAKKMKSTINIFRTVFLCASKIRFIDNEPATLISIIFSSVYMIYVGTYFGMGVGKNFIIFIFFIITSIKFFSNCTHS